MSHHSHPPRLSKLRKKLDQIGATGSLLCAVHCALMPLVLAALPSLGLSAWLGDGLEHIFVVFVSLLGGTSMILGVRRHRLFQAMGVMGLGLSALWLGLLYPPFHENVIPHAVVMTFGGTLVGVAHWLNLRLNHSHLHDASCAH